MTSLWNWKHVNLYFHVKKTERKNSNQPKVGNYDLLLWKIYLHFNKHQYVSLNLSTEKRKTEPLPAHSSVEGVAQMHKLKDSGSCKSDDNSGGTYHLRANQNKRTYLVRTYLVRSHKAPDRQFVFPSYFRKGGPKCYH